MEKLIPLWFLKHPLDSEQKSYILLDKLKKYQEELKKDQISNTLRDIFNIIKDLSRFKRERKVSDETYLKLNSEELGLLIFYTKMDEKAPEFIELLEVIEMCLEILYKYASIGMGLLDERNERIKTFEIIPAGSNFQEKANFGFLFLRNMVTDEITPYYWSKSYMGNNSKGEANHGIAIKKIPTLDPIYYSLSYINVAHELIEDSENIAKRETPRILICEIDENFNDNSDIVKTAKENFMNKLSEEDKTTENL